MDIIIQYLPFIIIASLLQYGLMAFALWHILTHNKYKTGSRVLWIVICLLINIIGPVLYFVIGRSNDEE